MVHLRRRMVAKQDESLCPGLSMKQYGHTHISIDIITLVAPLDFRYPGKGNVV